MVYVVGQMNRAQTQVVVEFNNVLMRQQIYLHLKDVSNFQIPVLPMELIVFNYRNVHLTLQNWDVSLV